MRRPTQTRSDWKDSEMGVGLRSIRRAPDRQRQHPRRSMQPHWRAFDHSPALGSTRDGTPVLICKIKIKAAGMLGHTDTDRTLGSIKFRARFRARPRLPRNSSAAVMFGKRLLQLGVSRQGGTPHTPRPYPYM